MSMRSYWVHGAGFSVDNLGAKETLQFLKDHIGTLRKVGESEAALKILEKIDLEAEDWSVIDDLSCDLNQLSQEENILLAELSDDAEYRLFRDTVALIIAKETGIGVNYEPGQSDDCYGEASIILPNGQPWDFDETEKKLTKEDFALLLEPYIKELGLYCKVDFEIEIEYYG